MQQKKKQHIDNNSIEQDKRHQRLFMPNHFLQHFIFEADEIPKKDKGNRRIIHTHTRMKNKCKEWQQLNRDLMHW